MQTRRLVSQGSDDGHALAGADSDGDLTASENSVIIIFFQNAESAGECRSVSIGE